MTDRAYQYNLGLRFEAVARERAGETALWFGPTEAVSYGRLNTLANRGARLLIERGVGRGDVVCLPGEKSPETFALMIACLKIGAVYCILDPESPTARVGKQLATCRPKLVVDQTLIRASMADGDEDDGGELAETARVLGSDPAYIMFTSGSTGAPKAAVITHASVLNLIAWCRETFSLTEADVLTNVNPLYFDNSVFDFYVALFTGARLVPVSKAEVTDVQALVAKIDAANCTVWFSVPSLLMFLQTMKVADGTALRSIRRFIFGGEGYPKAKLRLLYDAYADSSEFYNVYGPTECTCICSSYKVTAGDLEDGQGLPPLGRIADNFGYLMVDADGDPVAAGEVGELCLLGPNVGRGYYNAPEETAARFVPNPHREGIHELMYRTGDLVRLDPSDGNLYIHGRTDNQVKHMGYRIELEEIEAALLSLDYVSEAAAVHTARHGLSRLAAVVAPEDADDDRLRRDLGRIIPAYMIPSVFHAVPDLPRNANGKVDRLRLAERFGQPSPVESSPV